MAEVKEIYDVEITDVSTEGEGIGRAEGAVVFTPGLVPGDRARIRVSGIKKGIARGRALEILEPSPHRCEAPCPLFGKCGGCRLQELSYEAQLSLKEKQLRDKLTRIYGGEWPEPEPMKTAS